MLQIDSKSKPHLNPNLIVIRPGDVSDVSDTVISGRVRTESSGLEAPVINTHPTPHHPHAPGKESYCWNCMPTTVALASVCLGWQLMWALPLVIGNQPEPLPLIWPVDIPVFWLGNKKVKQGCTVTFFMGFGNKARIWGRSGHLWLICCI